MGQETWLAEEEKDPDILVLRKDGLTVRPKKQLARIVTTSSPPLRLRVLYLQPTPGLNRLATLECLCIWYYLEPLGDTSASHRSPSTVSFGISGLRSRSLPLVGVGYGLSRRFSRPERPRWFKKQKQKTNVHRLPVRPPMLLLNRLIFSLEFNGPA